MDQQQIEQLETEESMFVQTARGISNDGATLTLRDVTPSTLFFSDRPRRVAGHMTTSDFVELWGEGDNSFEADPPNAVDVLEGTVPVQAGPVTLFIDPLGRPLSPVSVCGVRRRERRRARR